MESEGRFCIPAAIVSAHRFSVCSIAAKNGPVDRSFVKYSVCVCVCVCVCVERGAWSALIGKITSKIHTSIIA
jgi:hypothetical protein